MNIIINELAYLEIFNFERIPRLDSDPCNLKIIILTFLN